jgi:multiple sugar transport system substrate-binding protein
MIRDFAEKYGRWVIWEILVVVFCGSILLPALTALVKPVPVQSRPVSSEGGAIGKAEPTQKPTAVPDNYSAPYDGTGRVEIRWFVGLGAGSEPTLAQTEQSVVDEFNRSQDTIELVLRVVDYDSAAAILITQFQAGDGPDLVGPAGWAATNPFHDQWLDLSRLIQSNNTDLSLYNPALVDMYHTEEGQVGLPFIVYPGALFYNPSLFDAAGLSYPPDSYGREYRMPDGTTAEWNWDTLAEVARLLTVDSYGRNATESGFNSNDVVQYGFTWQWQQHVNYIGSYWGGGSLVAPGGTEGDYSAQVPDVWRAAWEWTYLGIWGDEPFMASENREYNEDLGSGNAFNSGKFGMTIEPIWFTCCMFDLRNWDVAAIPSYNGRPGGRVDADTLRIWKYSKHPQEAYTVMQYLLNQGVETLMFGSTDPAAVYGGISARTVDQQIWRERISAQFPWVRNWQVVVDGLNYPDIPSAEHFMPNYPSAWARGTSFSSLLRSTPGLDVDAEIEAFRQDLARIFNQ